MKAIVDDQPVLINDQPVQIFFNYGEKEVELREGSTVVRAVECVIRPFPQVQGEEPEPFSTGTAFCSPLDLFEKRKGRFLAWRRAVQGETGQARFTREQRRQLWSWFTASCSLPDDTSF